MKRVAIIGSGSFLAKNFIKYSVDNSLEYQFELYGRSDYNNCPHLRYKKINFGKIEDIRNIDFSVDVIMIFIGKTGTVAGFKNYKDFIEVNEMMLLNILDGYVNAQSKARIIYPSSRLIFKSNEMGMVDESGERECKSIYAVTKQAAENYLKIYKDIFNVQSVIIRICTPFGTLLENFGNYGTFEIFTKQAINEQEITVFGNGQQVKTFTDIRDICKAFSLLIDSEFIRYDDYNLGGQRLRLIDIAQKIANEYDVKIRHLPWPHIDKIVDGGSLIFDSSRFDEEFKLKYTKLIPASISTNITTLVTSKKLSHV